MVTLKDEKKEIKDRINGEHKWRVVVGCLDRFIDKSQQGTICKDVESTNKFSKYYKSVDLLEICKNYRDIEDIRCFKNAVMSQQDEKVKEFLLDGANMR